MSFASVAALPRIARAENASEKIFLLAKKFG
jgi:hypothetical protein